jgi:hypothetical protein
MISFGSDPEFILIDTDGNYRTAIGIVQGDRENRISLQGHQFFYDNVMAECAIKPARSKKKTLENFRECLQLYADMVRPYKLHVQASHTYSETEMRHPATREAGCEPDYCAYQWKLQKPPKRAIEQTNLRSCGGHIHLGHPILTSDGPEPLLAIFMLDLMVGVPSLWLDKDPTSAARRGLYGKAGRYRPKDYGLEYRSLGNFWLQSPQLVSLVFDLCRFAVEMVADGRAFEFWSFDEEVFFDIPANAWTCHLYDSHQLRRGVDTNDKGLLEKHYALMRSLLPTKLIDALDSAIEASPDLYKSWKIT